MQLTGKMMKRVISLILITGAASVGGLLLKELENGTLSLWPRDLVEDTMAQIATIDPVAHAVLSDHIEEAREILETADKTKDWDTGRRKILAMASAYAAPALSNADEALAITVAEKALNLFEVLSVYHQDGCLRFVNGSLSTPDFSRPRVGEAYRVYSEALRVAYVDGKSNSPGKKLPVEQIGLIAEEALGLTENDAGALQDPARAEPQQLCEALKKFFNTKLLPPSQKGIYARTIISGL